MFSEAGLCIDTNGDSGKSSGSSQNGHGTDTSDTEHEDSCASPRVQRRKRRRRKSHGERTDGDGDDLAYVDTLPDVSETNHIGSKVRLFCGNLYYRIECHRDGHVLIYFFIYTSVSVYQIGEKNRV